MDTDYSCKQTIGKVFTIMEKAPTRAFSWLKVHFHTIKTLGLMDINQQ